MAVARKNEENELRAKLHEVKDELHEKCHVSQCLGPIMDNYIEEVIDLTEKIDELKQSRGEPIELEY